MWNRNRVIGEKPGRFAEAVDRIFPERQFVIRTEGRVSYFRLRPRFQIVVTGVFVCVMAWGLFTSFSFVLHDKILQAKNGDIANARLAYHSLLNEVAEYQRKFTQLTDDLEDNHVLMLGLVEKNANLQQSLSSVSRQLELTEAERQEVIDNQSRLRRQISELTTKIEGMSTHNLSLRDNLTNVESRLQSTRAERNRLQFDVARLERLNDGLENQLALLQKTEGEAISRLTDRIGDQIEDLENVVKLSGLPLNQIVGDLGADDAGQGGPYIPLDSEQFEGAGFKATLSSLNVHLDKLETLRDTIARMPLAAPMKTYYITSSFGKRRDPITKRWSAHYGVDLGGRKKAPIFVTAPGKVTFAGWKGRYGRLIEVDHGGGIKTRYGHLHKITVKKGQSVKFHDKIGLLGNSGRSTGPHLHYEVVYDGKPLNPMKFFRAGRYVFKDQ